MRVFRTDSYYPIDLGILPVSWDVAYVGDLTRDIQPGFASGRHNQEGIGVPHLRPMNIDRRGYVDFSLVKYVSVSAGRHRLRRGDVLFNNTNSPELIGKTAHIDQDAELAFSNHMTRLRLPDGLLPKFVAHHLHFLWMSGYFLHRCVKHVNQASVSSSALAETVPLVIAPLPEQHRIVAEIEKHFTRLDAAVAALQRARANLKRYRASVLKAACEGSLVPTEAELARQEGRDYEPAAVLLGRILKERRSRWEGREQRRGKYKEPQAPEASMLSPLPEGWQWATLGQIADIQGGIQKQPKRVPRNNAFPFLRVANVFREYLDLSEVHSIELFKGELEKLRLEPDDLLIVEGNGSASQIGRMAIWDGSVQNCVHQNHIIRARMLPELHPRFISAYWNSPDGTERVTRVAASTSGLYTLSVSKVSVIHVPLPPLAEQQRIVGEIECRLSVTRAAEIAVEANLRRATRLRQAILKRAFEGKLVPQDSSDEPASALLERIRTERDAKERVSNKPRGRASRGSRSKQGVLP